MTICICKTFAANLVNFLKSKFFKFLNYILYLLILFYRSNDIRSLLRPSSQKKQSATPQNVNREPSTVSTQNKNETTTVGSEWLKATWQFRVNIENIVLGAALLPSLRGEYKVDPFLFGSF